MTKRGPKQGGAWLYPSTRWAIYLRDGCQCVYCGVTMAECVEAGGPNFLTVDHVVARSKALNHAVTNLITCCFECNSAKGTGTQATFIREWGYTGARSRSQRRRRKDIEQFRLAAKILLGLTEWATIHQTVIDHDWLVQRQFRDEDGPDGQAYWQHLKSQGELWCSACNRALPDGDDDAPEPIPF